MNPQSAAAVLRIFKNEKMEFGDRNDLEVTQWPGEISKSTAVLHDTSLSSEASNRFGRVE